MSCPIHPQRAISSKCENCSKFVCAACVHEHKSQNHRVSSLVELNQAAQEHIQAQLIKIDLRVQQLSALGDYEMGEAVIDSCHQELAQYLKALFDQIKAEYRSICDHYCQAENAQALTELQERREILRGWAKLLREKKEKVQCFHQEKVLELNRLETQDDLYESTHSYIHNSVLAPKIDFNEVALRRAHQSLSKIIYIARPMTGGSPYLKPAKNLKRSPSRRSNKSSGNIQGNEYQSLCKFIEGTPILYQLVLCDPNSEEVEPQIRKIEFREFTTPMRSVGISQGNSIYLLGGNNRDRKPSKEIWMYQRNYSTMRVVGLMRQARSGHAVCSHTEILYVFGGGSQALQQFDTRSKNGRVVSEYKRKELEGSSITCIREKIYIFGGLSSHEPHHDILVFDLIQQSWQQVRPCNAASYAMPVGPLLCPLGDDDILVFGGYFSSGGQSYNNLYLCSFNIRNKYYSPTGKGEMIYPLLSSAQSCLFLNGKLYALADLKRERHRHGPNLPALLTYNFKEDLLAIDALTL